MPSAHFFCPTFRMSHQAVNWVFGLKTVKSATRLAVTRQAYSAPAGSPDESGVRAIWVSVSCGMLPPRVAISTGTSDGVILGVSVQVGSGVIVGKKVGVNEGVRVGAGVSVKTGVMVGGDSWGCGCSGCDNSIVLTTGGAAGAGPGTGIVKTQADDTRMAMLAAPMARFFLSIP